jgi:hypothetical protein
MGHHKTQKQLVSYPFFTEYGTAGIAGVDFHLPPSADSFDGLPRPDYSPPEDVVLLSNKENFNLLNSLFSFLTSVRELKNNKDLSNKFLMSNEHSV